MRCEDEGTGLISTYDSIVTTSSLDLPIKSSVSGLHTCLKYLRMEYKVL